MNTQTIKKRITIAILMLFLFRDIVIAQAPEVDKEAERILTNYISAICGEKAISKIENIIIKSDMSIIAAGVNINREMVQDKANNLYIKAYTPQTGELFRGFDGETFWEKSSNSGQATRIP